MELGFFGTLVCIVGAGTLASWIMRLVERLDK